MSEELKPTELRLLFEAHCRRACPFPPAAAFESEGDLSSLNLKILNPVADGLRSKPLTESQRKDLKENVRRLLGEMRYFTSEEWRVYAEQTLDLANRVLAEHL